MKTENDAPKRTVNKFKEMARTVIKHHFGSNPRRIFFKASGLTNFVFSVVHKEGDFVVRMSPEPSRIDLFYKEQWAQTAAKKVGVPTAEILEVGIGIVPFPFMISRTVKGGEATHHPQRMEILREMGRYAALINSIPTKGFGKTFDWSGNTLSRNETWKEYLEIELEYEKRLQTLEKYKATSPAQLKQLRKILADAVKMKPNAVLNHSDMRLKNVIADEKGKICAVIDWEGCTSNIAPAWELSIALHDLWIDEKQVFLEGYGIGEKKIREIAPLMKDFNFINYARTVEQMAQAKDTARLEQYRNRLSGVLDLYSL
jgi:aminoglycoside phosphotransferase (APT) family kinase protein